MERTLSGTTYIALLERAKQRGFQVYIYYLWLPNPTIAIARVRERVKMGGHDVPVADIRRRYGRSLRHFVDDYAPLADRWAVWDNQTSPPRLMGESETRRQSQPQSYTSGHMKYGHQHRKKDDFIAPARRAFRRVARQIHSDHAKLGLPLVFGNEGKVRLVRAG